MKPKPRKNDKPARNGSDWHTVEVGDVLEHFRIQDQGLTTEEALRRLAQYGPNTLRVAQQSLLADILKQLNVPMVVIFLMISIILAALGSYIESGAVLIMFVLNAVIGVLAQRRAAQVTVGGNQRVAPEARVLRDGRVQIVPTEQLVPGDIIPLESGDTIPADIRLIKTINLRVDENILTGIARPVQKNAAVVLNRDIPLAGQKNTAFMGTIIMEGWGHGAVIDTGMRTQLGLNIETLRSVGMENTPLQQHMNLLVNRIVAGISILACVLALINLRTNTQLAGLFRSPLTYIYEYPHQLANVFLIMAGLLLAAIPHGILSMGTISLLVGIREMLRRHVQIQHLDSVEKLSTTTAICLSSSDLLVGTERVVRLWVDGQFFEVGSEGNLPVGDFKIKEQAVDLQEFPAAMTLLWLGVLNSNARMEVIGRGKRDIQVTGDPTESAFLIAAAKAGASPMEIQAAYPRIGTEVLDAERKLKITVSGIKQPMREDVSPFQNADMENWNVITVKGPPEELLTLCDLYQLMNDNASSSQDESFAVSKSTSLVNYQSMTDENVDLDRDLQAHIMTAYTEMSRDGLQVVGLAYRIESGQDARMPATDELAGNLIFVGLMGLSSEPREEVILSIQMARRAGIRTILMTEESFNATRSISTASKLLQPGHNIFAGTDMDRISDQDLLTAVEHTDLYTRVSLEQKQLILDTLRAGNEVVTMIGDNREDASVINRADIRVVDGLTGSKFPTGAAEVVIRQDMFISILSAIEQARTSIGNIHKLVFFLVSSYFSRAILLIFMNLAGLPLPFTILQLLWMNLMNIAPALALTVERGDWDVMNRRPDGSGNSLIPSALGFRIFIKGGIQAVIAWMALMIGINFLAGGLQHNWQTGDFEAGVTLAFAVLAMSDLFCAYTTRSERKSVLQIGLFSNRYMQYAVELSFGLLLLACYVPSLRSILQTQSPTFRQWFMVVALALVPAALEEIIKLYLRKTQTLSE